MKFSRSGGFSVLALLFAVFAGLHSHAAVTVTDSQGVIYDIQGSTMNVVVSADNKSLFGTKAVDIVIPQLVTDVSTTAVTSDPYTVVGIANNAFQGTAITSVNIEAPIARIPDFAFNACPNLVSVNITTSITHIGQQAFAECANLQTISALVGVTDIGQKAFQNCSMLGNVVFGDGLSNLGIAAFENCASLTAITIPGSLRTLSNQSFKNCTSLSSVTINEGTEIISRDCFRGCTVLKSPDFPSTIKEIGQYSFADCDNLGTVALPGGATIQQFAYQCSGLDEIVWPDQPITFHSYVFSATKKLTSVIFPAWMITVPEYMFDASVDLAEVTTVDGVEAIGAYSFRECPKLQRLTLAPTTQTIRRYAFYKCQNLEDVNFPKEMKQIETLAFAYCSSFKHLVLPAGADMGSEAFSGTSLESISWPDAPMGTIQSGPFGTYQPIKSITIPAWMEIIPAGLCSGFESLEEVVFEEGPATINNSAFYKCSSLTSVTLPGSMHSIKASAFNECAALSEFHFNEGLEEIGNSFYKCTSLTNITLPSTLSILGPSSFGSCTNLETVRFADGSVLREIGNSVFENCYKLAEINFPEGLEKIHGRAFCECRVLAVPQIPTTLGYVGNMAFYNCWNYGSLTLNAGMTVDDMAFRSAGVTSIDFPTEPCEFGKNVFQSNGKISSLDFPAWMTNIPEGFCRDWSLLDHIEFSDKIESISDFAFNNCRSLYDVEFKPSISYIGKSAFEGCNRTSPKFGAVDLYEGVEVADNAFSRSTVTELRFHGCADFANNVFANVNSIESIEFPDCMSEIPDGFCSQWLNLKSVKFPETLTKIGKNAFFNCQKLDTLDLSVLKNLEHIDLNAYRGSGIKQIIWPERKIELSTGVFAQTQLIDVTIPAWMDTVPEQMFYFCERLEHIGWEERPADAEGRIVFGKECFRGNNNSRLLRLEIPNDIDVEFMPSAFAGNVKMTGVDFGNGNITLGNLAFEGCRAITDLKFPASVTEIPDGCFRYCTTLRQVDFSPNTVKIGESAFGWCYALESVDFPKAIETLDGSAFVNDTSLREVTIPGTIKTIPKNCFQYCTSLEKAILEEGIESIQNVAFHGCSALQEIRFPSSCKTIGDNAFKDCSSLEKAVFNDGIERIEFTAFSNTPLVELEFPPSLQIINNSAFSVCPQLQKITIHSRELDISYRAFYGDTSLREVYCDGGLKSIGQGAFMECSALTDFTYDSDFEILSLEADCFNNCASLKAFPYLTSTALYYRAFQNCTSLAEIRLPYAGKFAKAKATGEFDSMLKGCTSLQSIVWPSTDKYFALSGNEIAGAPLEALSYSYVRGIDMPTSLSNVQTIANYDAKGNVTTDPSKSKLMVMRGEKWKYAEAGYGALFDIEEMKDPRFEIEGGIFSTFDPESNVNHYKVSLRWEVPLSDLNADGDTHVTIFRDDDEIAEVLFVQPTEPTYNETYKKDVIAVDVRLRRKGETEFTPTSFTGDFYFPTVKENGDTIYEMQYNTTESTMYFDAQTHKRQVAFDKYGYTSWFTFVDEFDSPAMDSGRVPLKYAYSAKMDAYDYSVPVNNAGYEPGDDGLRYHYEARSTADMEDGYVMMYTAMATPVLSGPGIYAFDEVAADTDHSLSATEVSDYRLTYSMNADLLRQRGSVKGTTVWMFDQLQTWVTDENGRANVADMKLTGTQSSGNVPLSPNSRIEPGNRYQTVVHSLFRGTFGSPTLTVPAPPQLSAEENIRLADHVWELVENHRWIDKDNQHACTYTADIALRPDLKEMGFAEGTLPADGDWHLGMWRNVSGDGAISQQHDSPEKVVIRDWTPYAATDYSEHDLLHHVDGLIDQHPTTECDRCSDLNGLTTGTDNEGNATATYTDNFDTVWEKPFNVDYSPRLYAKVPSTMLPAQESWMVADATVNHVNDNVTGIENVLSDTGDGKVRWFDLRGIETDNPRPGNPYIKVIGNKSFKTIYR